MSGTVRLRESQQTEVELTTDEAQSVAALGRALASKATYGSIQSTEVGADEAAVISCLPFGAGRWRLFVNNAIGAFGVGDTTFIVEPKIPINHVLYILSRASAVPRLDTSSVMLGSSNDFWEVVALWFLGQVQGIIARDLIRDYQNTQDIVPAARGEIDPIATSGRYYAGSMAFSCLYDDFTVDNAYNRVLRAALATLINLGAISTSIRRDCQRALSHFYDVGVLQQSDIQADTDRRTAHYADGLALARLIISANSVAVKQGDLRAWTFLIRTPDAIEAGIRAVLKEGLQPAVQVRKYGTALEPRSMSINPDLRFDALRAVGDVKYKVFSDEWPRGDLYQSAAFAAGSGASRSCVVSFATKETRLPAVHFKSIEVSSLIWDASEETPPNEAAQRLVRDCQRWLQPLLDLGRDVAFSDGESDSPSSKSVAFSP